MQLDAEERSSFLGPLLARVGCLKAADPLPVLPPPQAAGGMPTNDDQDEDKSTTTEAEVEEEAEVAVPFSVRMAEAERRMEEQLEVHRQLDACLRSLDDVGQQVNYERALRKTGSQAWTMQASIAARQHPLPQHAHHHHGVDSPTDAQHHHQHEHLRGANPSDNFRHLDPNVMPQGRIGDAAAAASGKKPTGDSPAPVKSSVTIVRAYLDEPVAYVRRTLIRRPALAPPPPLPGTRSVSIAPSPKITTYERGESDTPPHSATRVSSQTRSSLRRSTDSAGTPLEDSSEFQAYRAFSRTSSSAMIVDETAAAEETAQTSGSFSRHRSSASLDRKSSQVRISYVGRNAPRTSVSSPTATASSLSSEASSLLDETDVGNVLRDSGSGSIHRTSSRSRMSGDAAGEPLPADWQSLVGIMRQICSQAADQLLLPTTTAAATGRGTSAVDRRTIEKRIARATVVSEAAAGEDDPDAIQDVKNLKRFIRSMKTELVALEQRRIAQARKAKLLRAATKLSVARVKMQQDRTRRLDDVIEEVDEVFDERTGGAARGADEDSIPEVDFANGGDGSPRHGGRRRGDMYGVEEDDEVLDPFEVEEDGDEIEEDFVAGGGELVPDDGDDDNRDGGQLLDELASKYQLLDEEQEFAGYLAGAVTGTSGASEGAVMAPSGFIHVSKVIRYDKKGSKNNNSLSPQQAPALTKRHSVVGPRAGRTSSSSSSVASFVSSVAEEESLLQRRAMPASTLKLGGGVLSASPAGRMVDQPTAAARNAGKMTSHKETMASDVSIPSEAEAAAGNLLDSSSSESSAFFDPVRHKQKLIRRQQQHHQSLHQHAQPSSRQFGQITFVVSDAGSVSTNVSLKQTIAEQGLSRRTRSGLLMGFGGGERQRTGRQSTTAGGAGSLFDLVRARSFAASTVPEDRHTPQLPRSSSAAFLSDELVVESDAQQSSAASSSRGSDADGSSAHPPSTSWNTSSREDEEDDDWRSSQTGANTSAASSRERRLARRRRAALRSIAPLSTFSALYDPCESTPSVNSEDRDLMFRLPDEDCKPHRKRRLWQEEGVRANAQVIVQDEISPVSAETPMMISTKQSLQKKQESQRVKVSAEGAVTFFPHPSLLAASAVQSKNKMYEDASTDATTSSSTSDEASRRGNDDDEDDGPPKKLTATPAPNTSLGQSAGRDSTAVYPVGASIDGRVAMLSGSALGKFWGADGSMTPHDDVRYTGDGNQHDDQRLRERQPLPTDGYLSHPPQYDIDDLVAMADWKRRQSEAISSLLTVGDTTTSPTASQLNVVGPQEDVEAVAAAHHWAILETLMQQRFGGRADSPSYSESTTTTDSTSDFSDETGRSSEGDAEGTRDT